MAGYWPGRGNTLVAAQCSYSLKLPLLPHNEFENQLELFHEDHIIDNDLIDEDYRDADDVTTENSDLSLQSNLEQNDELEEMMYEQVICEENLYENEFYDDFPVWFFFCRENGYWFLRLSDFYDNWY